MAEEQFDVELRLPDEELADEAEAWFLGQADNVSRSTDLQAVPLIPFVIAGLLTVAGLAQLILWIRAKTRCQVIIDARYKKIRKSVDCSQRDGRVIVLTKDDERVQIYEAAPIVDFKEIVGAAISGGAQEVLGAAIGAGLRADREPMGQ